MRILDSAAELAGRLEELRGEHHATFDIWCAGGGAERAQPIEEPLAERGWIFPLRFEAEVEVQEFRVVLKCQPRRCLFRESSGIGLASIARGEEPPGDPAEDHHDDE
jgi:hypothetical protein